MGMRYYPNHATTINLDYLKTFSAFALLESFMESRGGLEEVAYIKSYDCSLNDLDQEEMDSAMKLWDHFIEQFSATHPAADIYIDHIGNDVEGVDAPEQGWYIGLGNYFIPNPAVADLDSHIYHCDWVTWG